MHTADHKLHVLKVEQLIKEQGKTWKDISDHPNGPSEKTVRNARKGEAISDKSAKAFAKVLGTPVSKITFSLDETKAINDSQSEPVIDMSHYPITALFPDFDDGWLTLNHNNPATAPTGEEQEIWAADDEDFPRFSAVGWDVGIFLDTAVHPLLPIEKSNAYEFFDPQTGEGAIFRVDKNLIIPEAAFELIEEYRQLARNRNSTTGLDFEAFNLRRKEEDKVQVLIERLADIGLQLFGGYLEIDYLSNGQPRYLRSVPDGDMYPECAVDAQARPIWVLASSEATLIKVKHPTLTFYRIIEEGSTATGTDPEFPF